MKQLCDLHTHSCFSDGTESPAGIVARALGLGLSAVALTDHNTVAGLPEFLDAARGNPIRAVGGVEISTGYQGKELHILGLFLEPWQFDRVTDFLSVINRRKEDSNRALVQALNREGYALDYDAIRSAHPGNVNRAVIAAALLEKGYIREIREAFQELLAPGGPCYREPERIDALEAIGFLASIGAVPVLAHPFLNLGEDGLRGFLPEAVKQGLVAMETRYPLFSDRACAAASRIAGEFHLLESGGSDFHGSNKPDIHLGTGRGTLHVPASFSENLALSAAGSHSSS